MTKKEAIQIFRRDIECLSHEKCTDCILEKTCNPMMTPSDSEYIEAFKLAVEALEFFVSMDDLQKRCPSLLDFWKPLS